MEEVYYVFIGTQKIKMVSFLETEDEIIISCNKVSYGGKKALEILKETMGVTGKKKQISINSLREKFKVNPIKIECEVE